MDRRHQKVRLDCLGVVDEHVAFHTPPRLEINRDLDSLSLDDCDRTVVGLGLGFECHDEQMLTPKAKKCQLPG